jgi:hypothetical protein
MPQQLEHIRRRGFDFRSNKKWIKFWRLNPNPKERTSRSYLNCHTGLRPQSATRKGFHEVAAARRCLGHLGHATLDLLPASSWKKALESPLAATACQSLLSRDIYQGRLRVPPRTGSTAARSPSSERRPPMSRPTMALSLLESASPLSRVFRSRQAK